MMTLSSARNEDRSLKLYYLLRMELEISRALGDGYNMSISGAMGISTLGKLSGKLSSKLSGNLI